MSKYNSENTKVLAMHTQTGGNTRMLLYYEHGSCREFIIGSYFKAIYYDGALGYERFDYSWDWGHYFSNFEDAARYWLTEVLSNEQKGD